MNSVTLDPLIRSAGLIWSPLGGVIVDTRLRIVWANPAARRLGDGLPAAAWAGRRLGEVLPRLGERSLRRVLATGNPVDGIEVSSHADGDAGRAQFWSREQFRANGPDGSPGPPS